MTRRLLALLGRLLPPCARSEFRTPAYTYEEW